MRARLMTLCLASMLLLPSFAKAARKAAERPKKSLRVGAIMYGKEATRETVKELARYLERGIGQPIEPVFFNTYRRIILEMSKRTIDLAVLTPFVFLKVREMMKVYPLAMPMFSNGKFTYRCSILVRKADKRFKRIRHLRGCNFGYVDRLSSSGYVVPRAMMEDAGIDVDRDISVRFLGNHIDVVKALDEGKVDAVGTFLGILQFPELKDMKGNFKVLAKSDPLPNDVVVAAKWVPWRTRKALRQRLLDFHYLRRQDRKLRSMAIHGFVPADEHLYVPLERLYRGQ